MAWGPGARRSPIVLCAALLAACALPPRPAPVADPPRAAPLPGPPPRLALVLGGGAARGYAHVGVINVLAEAGIEPDLVVGTSAGAIAGALYAGGFQGEALVAAVHALRATPWWDWGVPRLGLLSGAGLQQAVNQLLDHRPLQALDRRLLVVAVALETGRPVAFSRGDTGLAVRASAAVPGIFQPVTIGARRYLDGGLVSPVPVDAARAAGARCVIAVDVSRRPEYTRTVPGTLSVLHQSLRIMGRALADRELARADLVIRPALGDMSSVDFDHPGPAVAAGRAAAEAALPGLRERLAGRRCRR